MGLVSTPETWLKVAPTSGLSSAGETKITVTAEANPNTSSRSASLAFAAGTARKTVIVTQDAATTAKYDAPEGYELVWHDEFDGNQLSDDWTEEQKPAGWVNNELQNYIKGTSVMRSRMATCSSTAIRRVVPSIPDASMPRSTKDGPTATSRHVSSCPPERARGLPSG